MAQVWRLRGISHNRHYGDDWVMWPAGVFPLTGLPRLPILAT